MKKYEIFGLKDVFNVPKNEHVIDVVRECAREIGIDDEQFRRSFIPAKRQKKITSDGRSSGGRGNSGRRWITPTSDALVDEWYLKRDPNWLYSHPEYFWEGLACSYETSAPFVVHNLVKELKYKRDIPPGEVCWNIFDWGAGCGLTTAVLAKNFALSTVYYNDKSPLQREMFKQIIKRARLQNVTIQDDNGSFSELPELDLLVGIEIVEHFQEPMKHLQPLLDKVVEGGLFAHSSYWESEMKMPTLGHFREYDFGGGDIRSVQRGRDIYRGFRKGMERSGWNFLDWNPYNHKPRFYMKGGKNAT